MDHAKYMQAAIKAAQMSKQQGGMPIGAVLVLDDQIISQGLSLVWPTKDPSHHAETNCIRQACTQRDTIDLAGATLYATLESCSMCLGCASWANISQLYFGAYQQDIPPNPYEITDYHAETHAKRLTSPYGTKLIVKGGILRDQCAQLMQKITNWQPMEQ